MSEANSVVTIEKLRKRRSLWWLWLLLILAAFAGGIILGLKLSTMPLPYDVKGMLFPDTVQAEKPAETPAPAPETTEPPQAKISAEPTEIPALPAAEEEPAEEPAPAEMDQTTEEGPAASAAPVQNAEEEQEEISEPAVNVPAPGKYIGVDAALQAALKRAGISEENAEVTGVIRTKDDDGFPVYEVSFHTADADYSYTVNAYSGEIESWKVSENLISEIRNTADEIKDALEGKSSDEDAPEERITDEKAKEIAYRDAGVESKDVLWVRSNPEQSENGSVYVIEFRTASGRYSYRIDAGSGEILKSEKP